MTYQDREKRIQRWKLKGIDVGLSTGERLAYLLCAQELEGTSADPETKAFGEVYKVQGKPGQRFGVWYYNCAKCYRVLVLEGLQPSAPRYCERCQGTLSSVTIVNGGPRLEALADEWDRVALMHSKAQYRDSVDIAVERSYGDCAKQLRAILELMKGRGDQIAAD